ncbi:MAG: hypothetical protein EBR74_01370 [Flavobacteriia bacterium]|nr:hypothetical protein [Flavobacteriia bacterium]
MVGHKKDAIEEKISFVYVSIFLHFSTNARAISAEDWQKVFHHKDRNVIIALSRVMKVKNKATFNSYLSNNLLISSINRSLLLGPTPKETY